MVTVDPFSKWGIDFMTCKPTSANGHGYIIVVVDYFTQWLEALPTFSNDGTITSLFMFNHIIARFNVPKTIVTNHGSHFHNKMMTELAARLGFRNENSTAYYTEANGQIEVINRVLKIMIQRMLGKHKIN
jgi:transposase InsO family protein